MPDGIALPDGTALLGGKVLLDGILLSKIWARSSCLPKRCLARSRQEVRSRQELLSRQELQSRREVLRRPLAWFALAAFLCSLALPVLEAHPMGAADDAACRLPAGDEGGAAIGAPDSEETSEHCVVCHLQRGLSGASPSNVAAFSTPFESASHAWLDHGDPVSACSASRSSRGPPVLLSI